MSYRENPADCIFVVQDNEEDSDKNRLLVNAGGVNVALRRQGKEYFATPQQISAEIRISLKSLLFLNCSKSHHHGL